MPIISVVASVQVTEALKLLTGKLADLHNSLMQFDVWRNEWRKISIGKPLADCPTCGLGEYEALNAEARDFAAIMCGRHAVQISPSDSVHIDLDALRRKLESSGEVKANEYLLRFRTGEYELTIFKDARSIIRGTDDIATARSLYSKYIGN
jgi:adenylyltransferase/sulfurtransferase